MQDDSLPEFNPYASPQATGPYEPIYPRDTAEILPPWEGEGDIVHRFAATVRLAFRDATRMFRHMDPERGMGPALCFLAIGSGIGAAFSLIFEIVRAVLEGDADLAPEDWLIVAPLIWGFVPIIAIVAGLVFAGVFHAMLWIVGGANRSYTVSVRVYAYALGASALLNAIPLCGSVVGGVLGLWIVIIGLTHAHRTDFWRAAVAVILGCVLSCGIVVAAAVGLAAVGVPIG